MAFWDALRDGILDTVKLVPFLFLTYLLMEYIEHRTNDKTKSAIRRADRFAPALGAIIGIFPQCGFSAAASSLYAGRVITAGTLIAVFLSTSDEMLPIFLSNHVEMGLIGRILFVKVFYALIAGFVVDFLFRRLNRRKIGIGIGLICAAEHCECDKGIIRSAIKHTMNITLYIFFISIALNLGMAFIGTQNLKGIWFNRPFIGEVLGGLIGLVPNCAASVAITTMYLSGVMSKGAMIAGLMAGAGAGLLVLFRTNRDRAQNIQIAAILYVAGVLGGLATEAFHLI